MALETMEFVQRFDTIDFCTSVVDSTRSCTAHSVESVCRSGLEGVESPTILGYHFCLEFGRDMERMLRHVQFCHRLPRSQKKTTLIGTFRPISSSKHGYGTLGCEIRRLFGIWNKRARVRRDCVRGLVADFALVGHGFFVKSRTWILRGFWRKGALPTRLLWW